MEKVSGKLYFQQVISLCLKGLILFQTSLFVPALVKAQATVPQQGKAGVIEKSLRQSRPVFQPPPEVALPKIEIEDSHSLVDPGSGPAFFVTRVEITGNTLIDSETLAPLVDVGCWREPD